MLKKLFWAGVVIGVGGDLVALGLTWSHYGQPIVDFWVRCFS